MALPKKYPELVQPLIPSYNYSDVDEGTGITTYYASTAEKSTGEEYLLTTSQPYSHLVSISGALTVGETFSGTFATGQLNRPRIIKGTPTVNMTWRVRNSSSSNNNYPSVELFKYDGSNYTSLGFVSGAIINSANGAMVTTQLKIPNVTTTLIKAGEQIVIRPGITADTTGNSPQGYIACDPQNRDDDWFTSGNFDTTKLIANIPFKIVT